MTDDIVDRWLQHLKGLFTRNINVTVLAGGTFDLVNVMCKQRHRTALNPILTETKMVTLTVRVKEA